MDGNDNQYCSDTKKCYSYLFSSAGFSVLCASKSKLCNFLGDGANIIGPLFKFISTCILKINNRFDIHFYRLNKLKTNVDELGDAGSEIGEYSCDSLLLLSKWSPGLRELINIEIYRAQLIPSCRTEELFT